MGSLLLVHLVDGAGEVMREEKGGKMRERSQERHGEEGEEMGGGRGKGRRERKEEEGEERGGRRRNGRRERKEEEGEGNV